MKALIFENKVVQLNDKEFPVHPSLKWVDCDETITTNHKYENNLFIAPAIIQQTYSELRRNEMPPIDSLVIALWEKLIENRPEAAAALQTERERIKLKYPKDNM